MKPSKFLYVANWKMQFSFEKAISFCEQYKKDFEQLQRDAGDAQIILCPSFDSLQAVVNFFKDFSISIGAQNCCAYEFGPYTGEVSAVSLAQIGCEYCIVGHSERRTLFGETDRDVALKIEQLLKNGMTPIICIGETKKEYEERQTNLVIDRQLGALSKAIEKGQATFPMCIAYEPVWAIGTGLVPENEYIEAVFDQIEKIISKIAPEAPIALLYGGSVDDQSAKKIKQIEKIGGFLVGGASLDFQKFEKIVT